MSSRFRCELALPFTLNRGQFITAYQEAFRDWPYLETYTPEQVTEEVIDPHFRDGMIMIVTDTHAGGRLIGFGCALPFNKCANDVREFLDGLAAEKVLPQEFDHRNSWYMSELGVLKAYRGEGAAWELVLHRMRTMSHWGAKQFFMRTASVGSPSMPMYLKCGARELPVLQDVRGTEQDVENHTQALKRTFLWGNCLESAANIEQIQREKGYIPFGYTGDGSDDDIVPMD